jgi:PAS domain S-box-containing protein
VKTGLRKDIAKGAPVPGPAGIRARLAEAEATIRAIRNGDVDAVVVSGSHGERVFTLEGAGHAYRILIESMSEGALTLTPQAIILYANRCFARMVGRPLERVIGSAIGDFLSPNDKARLSPILERLEKSGRKIRMALKTRVGVPIPVQISLKALAGGGKRDASICVVVTDLSEARRSEEVLRALTHRIVRAQDTERGRVALELHDNITQLLCAVVFRSQALAEHLSPADGRSKGEAIKLREMLGGIANEIERISHDMGPGVLEKLGLVAVLRKASAEFADRTGLKVHLARMHCIERLPMATETALYRILQEALRNVEKHARASTVWVRLTQTGGVVRLLVRDDGIGCPPEGRRNGRTGSGNLGLASMRERAGIVGGTFAIGSVGGIGTEVNVQVPRLGRAFRPAVRRS